MEFSGEVFVKPVEISAESKKTIERSTSYIQGDASTAYILTATLYKVAPDLDAVAKRGYSVLKCKTTVSDSPLTIAGGRGRELRGSDCDKGVNSENRYFLKGKWLYHAIALYKKDGGDEKAARHFIQSFKPISPSAAENPAPATTSAVSNGPIIRTLTGVRYEIPAGWEWTEFDGYKVTLRHLGSKSGEKGKESSPNTFQIGVNKSYGNDYNNGWGKLDRDQKRTFSNGAKARWKAGIRFDLHYSFLGEATIGSKALSAIILGSRTPSYDVSLVESAFLRAAETLQDVPESTVVYHPSLRIAVERLNSESWYIMFDGRNLAFRCWTNPKGCGEGSNTWLFTYPSSIVFPDTEKALADITGHYEKTADLKIGEVRRAEFPGGEVLWTEQPGSNRPFLAAVRRDGRYFFVAASAGTSVTRTNDALRPDFLAIAKNVRAWDGK